MLAGALLALLLVCSGASAASQDNVTAICGQKTCEANEQCFRVRSDDEVSQLKSKIASLLAIRNKISQETVSEAKKASACEGSSLTISCPVDFVIEVIEGFYGRQTNDICDNKDVTNFRCSSGGADEVIKTACNNKQSCTVSSSNSVFGDPCYGTTKYAAVSFKCRRPSTIEQRTEFACEGRSLAITCPANLEIEVLEGFYGRVTNSVCFNKDVKTFSCNRAGATEVIKSLCDSKQSCTVSSSNSVFGDPCYGTSKYTSVNYRCRLPSVVKQRMQHACEGNSATISCPEKFTIQILTGFYGRITNNYCYNSNVRNFGCSSSPDGATGAMRTLCDDKQSCTIKSSNSVFGDPCFGTNKYMIVSYACRLTYDIQQKYDEENAYFILGDDGRRKSFQENVNSLMEDLQRRLKAAELGNLLCIPETA